MKTKGPLDGVRILEFTTAWAGPYATCLLGFLGAEIIKVESMSRPDHSRRVSFTTGREFETVNESEVFNTLNLGKYSISLNLKQPEAIEIAKRLAKVCDVVMENMRPGVVDRLGLGYGAITEIKPDIVYLSSSACGQTGPDKHYVGYAPTFAALAGMPHITGYPDWPPSNFMGSIDLRSATAAAFAILSALYYHQQTGEGQYIDLASQEAIAAFTGDILLDYVMNQTVQKREGNQDSIVAPHNCYRCSGDDMWISIVVATDEEWACLCRAMGMPELIDDERFSDPPKRKANEKQLDQIINKWTKEQVNYDLMRILQEAGVAAAPSLSSEALYNDPHLKQRHVFKEVNHPVLGQTWVIGPPWQLSETPAHIRGPGPLLGEHTDDVLSKYLGMSADEIKELKKHKVIY